MNAKAEFHCEFIGLSAKDAIPGWRITFSDNNGSIINNKTIDGEDICSNDISGLKCIINGNNNAPNSKLLVGPVNMTHNQSSYQCILTVDPKGASITVMSSVGTLTVVGKTS